MAKLGVSYSSFQKTNLKRPYVQGTRLSVRNAQLLISSGVSSFDTFIGGGLPIGTICCIEEDVSVAYSTLMLKHFFAEGILNGHLMVLASQICHLDRIVQDLPCPVTDGSVTPLTISTADQMKIAWRYENLNDAETANSKSIFGHIFDTSKTMDADIVRSSNINCWNYPQDVSQRNDSSLGPYLDLLHFVKQEIEASGSKVDSKSEKKNVIRVALHSLASPLWSETSDCKSEQRKTKYQFLKFMYCLKSIIRSSYAVCMVTVPAHLFQDACTVHRLRHIVDISVQLESFMDSEELTNEAYKEYSGLFHFKKLFAINTIVPHSSEGLDLAFKLRRKRFIIEKLCLPPDLSGGGTEISSTQGCAHNIVQHSTKHVNKGCCGSLDF